MVHIELDDDSAFIISGFNFGYKFPSRGTMAIDYRPEDSRVQSKNIAHLASARSEPDNVDKVTVNTALVKTMTMYLVSSTAVMHRIVEIKTEDLLGGEGDGFVGLVHDGETGTGLRLAARRAGPNSPTFNIAGFVLFYPTR